MDDYDSDVEEDECNTEEGTSQAEKKTGRKKTAEEKKYLPRNQAKYFAISFKKDCIHFLEEFEKKQSFNYDHFVEVWQATRFTLVYAGQEYAYMVKDTCNYVFYTLKKIFTWSNNIHAKTGAFYLLYGLYFKQPLKGWMKIYLTLEEFSALSEFLKLMIQMGENDVLYCYQVMREANAFVHVALPNSRCLETGRIRSYDKYFAKVLEINSESKIKKEIQELLRSDLCEELKSTRKAYDDLSKRYTEGDTEFTQFNSKLLEDLNKAEKEIAKYYPSPNLDVNNTPSNSQEVITKQDVGDMSNDTKNKRAAARSRAVGNKNAVYRGSKKVITSADAELLLKNPRKKKKTDEKCEDTSTENTNNV